MALDRIRTDNELRDDANNIPRILLDANSLLMPFQFGLNLDIQLEQLLGPGFRVIVLSCVRDEVYGLAQGGNRHAKIALKLLEKYEQVEWKGKGDKAIIKYVRKYPGCIVLTNDKDLRSRAAALGSKTIMMYKRNYLGWDNE